MQSPAFDPEQVLSVVRGVLGAEAAAVGRVADACGEAVTRAVEHLANCRGRVIVSGVGKMSFVSRKMAATLCSTGTPALFLHPSEALHGDLGIVSESDILLALSNSGETDELLQLIPFAKRFGVSVISITGSGRNSLAALSDVALTLDFQGEADPVTDAPTNSTTACLALCDALAVALVHVLGFTREQFASLHPGGQLGRRLLLTVGDLMHRDDRIPRVAPSATLREAICLISEKALGAGFIVKDKDRLLGILTDGDLRRILERDDNPLPRPVAELMTSSPIVVAPDVLASEALRRMEDRAITVLPVVEQDRLVGALHLHDLLHARLS